MLMTCTLLYRFHWFSCHATASSQCLEEEALVSDHPNVVETKKMPNDGNATYLGCKYCTVEFRAEG